MKSPNEEDITLEVEIERLLPGGVGLAHAEGWTLFVSLAAPGDVLRVPGLAVEHGNARPDFFLIRADRIWRAEAGHLDFSIRLQFGEK